MDTLKMCSVQVTTLTSTQTVGGSLGFFKKLLPEVVSSLDKALQGASTSVQVPEL
jgi:hypothetical protein